MMNSRLRVALSLLNLRNNRIGVPFWAQIDRSKVNGITSADPNNYTFHCRHESLKNITSGAFCIYDERVCQWLMCVWEKKEYQEGKYTHHSKIVFLAVHESRVIAFAIKKFPPSYFVYCFFPRTKLKRKLIIQLGRDANSIGKWLVGFDKTIYYISYLYKLK